VTSPPEPSSRRIRASNGDIRPPGVRPDPQGKQARICLPAQVSVCQVGRLSSVSVHRQMQASAMIRSRLFNALSGSPAALKAVLCIEPDPSVTWPRS